MNLQSEKPKRFISGPFNSIMFADEEYELCDEIIESKIDNDPYWFQDGMELYMEDVC